MINWYDVNNVCTTKDEKMISRNFIKIPLRQVRGRSCAGMPLMPSKTLYFKNGIVLHIPINYSFTRNKYNYQMILALKNNVSVTNVFDDYFSH